MAKRRTDRIDDLQILQKTSNFLIIVVKKYYISYICLHDITDYYIFAT